MGLLDELFGAATEDDGGRLLGGALGEEVEALVANLLLLEMPALAQHPLVKAVDAGLNLRPSGLHDPDDVSHLDASRAEQALIGEVLGGEVADGELGEDDVGAAADALVELLVDDVPLGVNDALVLVGVGDADLGVLLLGLELLYY